jgi:hypothetical protein
MSKPFTIMPKIRLALATSALPVPLSLVGNTSGDRAYRTPYIILLTKLYAQFQPRRALDERDVVEARIKTPVRTARNGHDGTWST